jgi:MFS family permease
MLDNRIFLRATFAVICCSAFPMIVVGCYFVHIPWNMERLGIGERDLGLAILVFGIFFLISNQFSARFLVPRIGTKIVMSFAMILISFSTFLLVIVPSYHLFLFCSIPAGLGWGSSGPIGGIHAQLIEKHSKKIITPYYAMGFNIGIFLGGFLAAYFINNYFAPWKVFLTLAFFSIAVSILIYNYSLPKELDFKGKGEKYKIPEKKVLIFGFILFIVFGSGGIIVDWSPLWLTKELGAPLYLGGLGLIFYSLGGIIANLFSNQLINIFNEKIIASIFAIIASLILFCSILTMNIYVIITSFLFYGFFVANLVPLAIRQAVLQSSESIPTTVSNIITIGFSALLFAPAIIGFVAETLSLTVNMYALCFFVFLAGIIMFANFKN